MFNSLITKTIGNMTIRRKLISIIMLACTTSLVLVGAAFIGWQWFGLRRSMVADLSTQAKIIAENCKASIIFDAPADANDALKSLKAEPTIIFGGVYTPDREIFACYQNNVHDYKTLPDNIRDIGHIFSDTFLTVYEPVTVEDNFAGIVCLRSTLSNLYSTLKWNIIVVICMMLLVSVLIYFVSFRLQGVISEPILDLADVAKTISQKKEYSIRVDKQTKDEIGSLITAFNDMLEQIQQRDIALVGANELLEEKVKERTADLSAEVAVRRKTEEKLAQTVKKLTISNKELREFTRIAAHDLQTPLRAIGILSDWISEDYASKFDEKGQKHAQLLQGRAKRMSRLLNAVMHYSELSLVDKQQERLDLNIIMSKVIENIEPPDNVKITIENKLPTVIGVRRFIQELFGNLLTNAINCMDKPEGYIKIGCTDEDDSWKFSVADNGSGIEERYYEKIFKIFQMLALRDETEGVGIGLSIVKKIVELYDGRIWVESQPDLGSKFFFTLPKSKTEDLHIPQYAGSCMN